LTIYGKWIWDKWLHNDYYC